MDHVANYPVVRKLGEGATSEVFLCQDPFRGRQVAVKRIFPESLRDPARGRLFRKLFFTEASLAGKLDHPHIAQIYDAGIGEDSGYIVMEYVPGGTMERYCAPEQLLPVEQTVEIIFKCARALEDRSEEHTSELQSQSNLVCRLLLEKKKKKLNVRKQRPVQWID